jgi:hypothetical protein
MERLLFPETNIAREKDKGNSWCQRGTLNLPFPENPAYKCFIILLYHTA